MALATGRGRTNCGILLCLHRGHRRRDGLQFRISLQGRSRRRIRLATSRSAMALLLPTATKSVKANESAGRHLRTHWRSCRSARLSPKHRVCQGPMKLPQETAVVLLCAHRLPATPVGAGSNQDCIKIIRAIYNISSDRCVLSQ